MFEYIKNLWNLINNPNNDSIVVGFIIACFAILAMHIRTTINYRARLNDKDERIKDLVEERNKYQDLFLKQYNKMARFSSINKSTDKEEKQ